MLINFLVPIHNCFMQMQPDDISEDAIWELLYTRVCNCSQHISSLLTLIYIHMYVFIIYVHLIPL